jgi:hypothetical protein
MESVVEQDVCFIKTAIRQTKMGRKFQLTDVILWNVYNDQEERVGQTALFDRDLVVNL